MYFEVKKLAPKKMAYTRKEVEDKYGDIIYDRDKVFIRWKNIWSFYMETVKLS